MRKNIDGIKSTNGRNTLHVVVWEPEGDIKAIVQISHGMIEYVERYDEFAKFLNTKGILVIANDHLGHGATAACDDELGYFGEGRSRTVVDDLYEVTKYAKKEYGENTSYFLFGHSMGSFMARRYLITYGDRLTGAIICGTGFTPGIVLGFGSAVAGLIGMVKGEKYRSSMLTKLAFGSYNKRIKNVKTSNDWLSVNEDNVKKYNKDKFCTFIFTVNGYQTLFDVLKFIQKKSNYSRIPKKLPLFFIAGEEDPVGGYGKNVLKVATQYKECGVNEVETKLYAGDRHEILNEDDRKNVYEDVCSWLMKHISEE